MATGIEGGTWGGRQITFNFAVLGFGVFFLVETVVPSVKRKAGNIPGEFVKRVKRVVE